MDEVGGPAVPPHHVAWRALLAAHERLTAAVGQAMKASGVLGFEAYDVLLALFEAPEHRLRLADLAERALLSKSGLSRSVDRLETAGLLRRQGCAEDGRVWFAVLTPRGKTALERAWVVYRAEVDRLVGGTITPREADVLRDLLDRLRAAAEPPKPLSRVRRAAR